MSVATCDCMDRESDALVVVKQSLRVKLQVMKPTDDDPGLSEARDVSTATVKKVSLLAPDGTLNSKAASFLTDGTDGWIYADFAGGDSGEVDQVGEWVAEGLVVVGGGTYPTSRLTFRVRPTNWSESGEAF